MSQSLMPALIMAIVTAMIVSVCLAPTAIRQKSSLVSFYWKGFWMFIALIAAIAGFGQAALMADLDVANVLSRLQVSAVASFVFFVVFAWFRLSGALLVSIVRRFTPSAA